MVRMEKGRGAFKYGRTIYRIDLKLKVANNEVLGKFVLG